MFHLCFSSLRCSRVFQFLGGHCKAAAAADVESTPTCDTMLQHESSPKAFSRPMPFK